MFCGRHFEFLIRAGCKLRGQLARGLEPRLRKSGTRKFLGGSDHSPSSLRAISVISVPDLALPDRAFYRARVLKIQNGSYKTQTTRDKGNLIFYSYSNHREYTILLSRERDNRVNKGTKRMNSSPVVISCFYLTRFYWENRCLQILRNTVAPNSYLGL